MVPSFNGINVCSITRTALGKIVTITATLQYLSEVTIPILLGSNRITVLHTAIAAIIPTTQPDAAVSTGKYRNHDPGERKGRPSVRSSKSPSAISDLAVSDSTCSTSVTRRPPSASAPAQPSPGKPPPMKLMMAAVCRPAPGRCTRRTSWASPHHAARSASRARRARPPHGGARLRAQLTR
jgi:hypothetical protein